MFPIHETTVCKVRFIPPSSQSFLESIDTFPTSPLTLLGKQSPLQEAPRARLDICFIVSEIHHYFTVFGLRRREAWVALREQRVAAKTSQKEAMLTKAFS